MFGIGIPVTLRGKLLLSSSLLLLAAPLGAQTDTTTAEAVFVDPRPSGLQIGVYPMIGGFSLDQSEEETGVGLGVRLGYGFTPAVSGYLRADASSFGGELPFTLSHADAGVRVAFADRKQASKVVWYLEGGLSAERMAFELEGEDVTFSGLGGSFAGGAVYFTRPNFGIDASFGGVFSSLDEITVDGDRGEMDEALRSYHIRFTLGGTWYPMAR